MDRILVVLPNWYGETVFATPFLRALRAQHPGAFIATLGRPQCREVLLHNPQINEILTYDEQGADRGLGGAWRLALRLRAQRFETAYILRPSLSRTLLLMLAGISKRVGFETAKSGWLLTRRVHRPKATSHKAASYFPLLDPRHAVQGPASYDYVVGAQERQRARELLAAGARTRPLVILHPGANWPHKRWATERFAELGDRFATTQTASLIITGGPDDAVLAEAVRRRMRAPAVVLAGRTSLRELAACLEMADLVVAADTGVLHLAAALGRPLVALYGPTSPALTGPMGDPARIAVVHHPECCPQVPCYHPDRPPHAGMDSITVDEVYDAACKLLQFGVRSLPVRNSECGVRSERHSELHIPSSALGRFRTPHSALGQRVLIIGPSNIGDAILASGVVAAVRRTYPDAHLALAVGQRAKALFADDARIQTLVDTDAFDSLAGRARLAAALWRYHPTIVVDLRHTLYPLLLAPLRLWRYVRQPPAAVAHMRDRHLWKLRAQVPQSAATVSMDGTTVWLSAKDTAHVDGLCRRWNLSDAQRLVIICPGARSHIKRWGAEGFARVADRLMTELGAQVVFSGEPDEEPVIESVRALMGQRAYSAVGMTTIRQLGALMRRAQLVITNDSASLHLASAVRVPTVAIFGPTDEAKYGPTAPRSLTVRRRLFCAPCEEALCRFNHECMRFIDADEVFQAARELLGQETRDTGQGNAECGMRSAE